MRVTRLGPADYKRMPWKNGGGMTTELVAESRPDGGYRWRLSIAEVAQSGPFSDFSGYDRTIMLLEGAGFTLDFDRAPSQRIDRPLVPLRFDGGWKTDCSLIDGPIRDFNLIAARSAVTAELGVLQPKPGTTRIAPAAALVFHVLKGGGAIAGQDLATGDTLRFDAPETALEMVTPAPAVLAVLRFGA